MGDKSIFYFKQFHIHQGNAAMKVGTDSDLLGALANGGRCILDIGTGTGVLALMMAQRYPQSDITAIEIDDNAVIDAEMNFKESPFHNRIKLVHCSFQDYISQENDCRDLFDSIVCNPPYFDKSLECPTVGRTRARHSSSLPFSTLAKGASQLLRENGTFTVCIPPEVYTDFSQECYAAGFWMRNNFQIKSVPEKGVKRHILIFQKGIAQERTIEHVFCMRNSDRTISEWYTKTLKDFLL